MLLSVPNKRTKTSSDTYKVTVWDSQALAAAEYISVDRKQIITCSGSLHLDEYSVAQGKPMMRLDFASILDYGNTKAETPMSDKQKFVNMMDDIDDAKKKALEIKAKTTKVS